MQGLAEVNNEDVKRALQKRAEALEKRSLCKVNYELLDERHIDDDYFYFFHMKMTSQNKKNKKTKVYETVIGISVNGRKTSSIFTPKENKSRTRSEVTKKATEICWKLASELGLPIGKLKKTEYMV